MLEEYNFTVFKSEKKLPVEEIAEIDPGVIIMDYLLGDGYGTDLCLEVKQDPSTKHLPVIIMSANTHLAQIISDSKADAFIAKPFDLVEFAELIVSMAI